MPYFLDVCRIGKENMDIGKKIMVKKTSHFFVAVGSCDLRNAG